MEPRIQYAKTTDGVSIAFWTLGEGMPLVQMPLMPHSHVALEWQVPEIGDFYQRLAEKRMLIRYDGRGSGLSDRDVGEFPLGHSVLDLEAVVDRLGLHRFALLGPYHSGQVAITYAAHHPERVSHLLLWCGWARTSDTASPQLRGLGRLLGTDWELYTETLAHLVLGWSAGEPARRVAAMYREAVTQQTMQAFVNARRDADVTDLLPQVRSPTLVLHRRQVAFPGVDIALGLGSRIPDARIAILEGTSGAPYLGDPEAVLQAIDEFLGEGEQVAAEGEQPRGGLATILFTDVEGSTTLTERVGDAKARALLRTHNSTVRDALRAHGGSEVKTLGDGFMASFSSATRALECAIAMQRAFAQHNESAEEPLLVRVGLNAGEPIAEEEDLFGTAVILAARIAARAEGGEILVANVVRELAAGKRFLFSDRGDVALRGFEDPVRLYELRWREER